MPFKPGQSGNPKGGALRREQKTRLIKDLLGQHVHRAVAVIAEQLESEESADKQWAAQIVLSYVFGKPAQAVEVKPGEGVKSFKLVIESDE